MEIDLIAYKQFCTRILPLTRKSHGGNYLGEYFFSTTNLFGHPLVIDLRHIPSIKQLLIPPPIEASVLALMFQIIKGGMVCVDIGSGCGHYTLIASILVGNLGIVCSFETIPECFKLLQFNMQNNKIKNVQCVSRFLSDCEKTEKLSYFGGNTKFFFLNTTESRDLNKEHTIQVETASFDQFFQDIRRGVDFVKINISTHLSAIFTGMKKAIQLNPKIKILATFDKEKMLENGQDIDGFFDALEQMNLKIFLLPTLKMVDKEELLGYKYTKTILINASI